MIGAPIRIMKIVGAIICVLLQIILAPYITIGFAMPNFILAFVLVCALLEPSNPDYILPFVLGLIFDLISAGTIGALTFVCVLFTFVLSKLFILINNDTLFIPLALLALGCFCSEIAYGFLLILCGMDVSFLEAFMYRMLPCGLYDTVICLIAYPILLRVLSAQGGPGDISILS